MREIRKATTADCRLIHRMASEVFPRTYAGIISPDQIAFMMDWMYSVSSLESQMTEQHHTYLIASEDGRETGYVSVQPVDDDLWELQKIYVLPLAQGSGTGRYLFEQAVKYVKECHPAPLKMELHVNRNNPAIGFYEHLGMHKDREGDFDIGHGFYMNDYIMAMNI